MKKLIFATILLLVSALIHAQPVFDLGVKAGVNSSKMSTNLNDFNSESIVKAHVGAFARLGVGRVYIQPEAYFSKKGGEISSSLLENVLTLDYNNIDVPVLLGVKVIKGNVANVRIMAGPVFSFITSNDISGDINYTTEYFEDKYFGYQYGIGIDIWKFFIDARIENASKNLYVYPVEPFLNSKNKTFMVTVGFNIL